MKDNYVTVVAPMDDTPGFRAGILAGDRIIKINGKSAEKMALQDVGEATARRTGHAGDRDHSASRPPA